MAYTFPGEFFVLLSKDQASQHAIAHALPLKDLFHYIVVKYIRIDFQGFPSQFLFNGAIASSDSLKKLALTIAITNGLELSDLFSWSTEITSRLWISSSQFNSLRKFQP